MASGTSPLCIDIRPGEKCGHARRRRHLRRSSRRRRFRALLDFFALEADIGNPVLAAGIRAAGNIYFERLIEFGDALFEFFDEPAGEGFCFSDGEFAEFGAGAGDGAAPEGRGFDVEAGCVEFENKGVDIFTWHIDDEEILHVGGAEFARGIFFGEAGGGVHLSGCDASSKNGSADVVEARLLLGVDADVVAIGIWRLDVFDAGIEIEAEASVEFAEETVGRPAVLGEEMFQARAVAIFAQAILIAENFGDGSNDGDDLIVMDESIETDGEMRIGGESAADANARSLLRVCHCARRSGGGETDVVNFRVGAPDRAAGDRDFEFAREIVEIAVGGEQVRGFDGER